MDFRTSSDTERLESLMAPFGDSLEREMDNIPLASMRERLFKPELIERAVGLGAPLATRLDEQSRFYVAVDPGTSRGRSDTAVLSFVCTNRGSFTDLTLTAPELYPTDAVLEKQHVIIVGAESRVNSDATKGMVHLISNHIRAMRRRIEGLQSAKAFIIIESNSDAAVNILEYMNDFERLPEQMRLGNYEILHLDAMIRGSAVTETGFNRDAVLEPGLWTSNKNKGEQMERIETLLNERRIHFHQDFVTYSLHSDSFVQDVIDQCDENWEVLREDLGAPPNTTPSQLLILEARRRIRKAFVDQLLNMHRVELPRANLDAPRRYRFTGKIQKTDKDDIVSALGIGQLGLTRMRSLYGEPTIF